MNVSPIIKGKIIPKPKYFSLSPKLIPALPNMGTNPAGNIYPYVYTLTKFEKDNEYKKNLLENIGITSSDYSRVRAILGSNGIKNTLAALSTSSQNYAVGDDLINTTKGLYRANLHIHTLNSDGTFTTQELLDKAAKYGDYLTEINKTSMPFTIAITDHDTTEGICEATNIIYENPEKYKNLRLIMGAEITTFENIATDIVDIPTNAHILVYGINPEEQRFKTFITDTKKMKMETALQMIDTSKKIYQNVYHKNAPFLIDEAKVFSTQLREGVTGMFKHVDRYVKTKFILDEIIVKTPEVMDRFPEETSSDDLMKDLSRYYKPINMNNYSQPPEIIIRDYIVSKTDIDADKVTETIKEGLNKEHAQIFLNKLKEEFENYKITFNPKCRYVPNFEMLDNALSNQPDVLVGIAHPLNYMKKLAGDDIIPVYLQELYATFKEAFKEKGAFCETYYQSYSKKAKQYNEKSETADLMKNLAAGFNLYNTGGIDNHKCNLFRRY